MSKHHTHLCNECKLGIKAYQNLVGSLKGFESLEKLMASGDHLLMSSAFCFAVVKYAKPFIETNASFGKTRYPVKHLKGLKGFDSKLHEHLLELRNTLIAHDDLESIEPRLLQLCLSVNSSAFKVPVTIAVSNKCVAYPADAADVIQFKLHVESCVRGVLEKLNLDLAKVRESTLKNPNHAEESVKYEKDYGQTHISEKGSVVDHPNIMSDEWLNSNEPNFSQIRNGFRYEELKIRKDFYGPETVELPDGQKLQINPPPNFGG